MSAPGFAAIRPIGVPSVILPAVVSLFPPAVVFLSAISVVRIVSVSFSAGPLSPFILVLSIRAFFPSGHVFVAATMGSAVHVVTVVIAVLGADIWCHLKAASLYTLP